MDIGKSFGFVFEDEDWVTKILIGGLVNLVPIVNLANTGYSLRVLRNVAAGSERPLPEWGEFGDFIVKGLLVAVAGLIYAIPLLLLVALTAIVSAIGGAGASSAAGATQDTTGGIVGLCVAAIACVEVLYALLLALWLPAASVKFALSGEFGAFFRFGAIWAFIARNLGGYIVALLVSLLAAIVAGIVGGILCGIGALFTGFYAMLVYGHLFGQLARENGEVVPAPTA